MNSDIKGILLWAGFILICLAIYLISNRIKRQIGENGIETYGVISRITESGSPEEIDLLYYAKYRTEDGKEVEGLISNPSSDLEVGQRVHLKYHPKYKINARIIR